MRQDMMKRILLALWLVAVVGVVEGFAQSSMTDQQIIDFVKKETKAGTSQAQIVTRLMQKGVDVQQLRRIKRQYERQQGGQSLGQVKAIGDGASGADSRLRHNNGDVKEENVGMVKSATSVTKTSANGTVTYDENDYNYRRMNDEVQPMTRDAGNPVDDRMLDLMDEQAKMTRKVFGRDIFNKKNLTFEPNMNIATPQNYRLGAGDKVYIDVYGATQKTVEAEVSPDGTVTIEGYGPVALAGLTVDQANVRLRQTLGSRYASSSVKLTVGQTRTMMVNVMGEVVAPGTYTLSAFATVFHALYMAGGTNDIGTLRNIKVYRQGKLVSQVDVYDYILNGKLTGNVRLMDNDVIVVGTYDCLVNVTGKVKRPMYYEMKKSESMQSLIRYAGGFASDAYTQSVRVVRKNGRQYSVHNVTEFDMNSFRMADGDSVSVDSIIKRYENMVEIKGAVFRPGMYELGNDVSTVGGLLKMAEGVREDAFTAHAVMHRMKKDRTLEVISVDVQGILDGTVSDIPLLNEDVLFVPTKTSSIEEQTITIHGEVQYPGVYRYADNETLEDFVMQAGGLKESASVMKVDVARRTYDPKAMTSSKDLAETFSFELQDGFVINGETAFRLKPFDEVYIRKNPTYIEQKNVKVEGMVNFAGTYTLSKREMRLSDVVTSAGGVRPEGYVKGARLERRLTDDERERMEAMLRTLRNNSGNNDTVDVEKLNIGDTFSVGIDLEQAIANPGSSYDVVLRAGDRLVVPEYTATVKVSGAVMYPNTVSYMDGKSPSWYVRHAGGYGNTAKRSKTYIVHQNGMVEEVSAKTKVTPGCEIVVPEKVKHQNNPQNAAMLISAVSAMATVGAVLVTAFK